MNIKHLLLGIAVGCGILTILFAIPSCKEVPKYIEKLNGADDEEEPLVDYSKGSW